MPFRFFSKTLYSVVKEDTTRWLEGLVGYSCFTEISREGSWWQVAPREPGLVWFGLVQRFSPPNPASLAMEEPFRQQKAGPSVALFGAAIQQQGSCGIMPPRHPPSNKSSFPWSYPMLHEEKGRFCLVKRLSYSDGAPFPCNASAVNRGKWWSLTGTPSLLRNAQFDFLLLHSPMNPKATSQWLLIQADD